MTSFIKPNIWSRPSHTLTKGDSAATLLTSLAPTAPLLKNHPVMDPQTSEAEPSLPTSWSTPMDQLGFSLNVTHPLTNPMPLLGV